MHENEIAQQIVDAALRVHMALGPGLLESVYQAALEYELKKRRLRVSPQQAIASDLRVSSHRDWISRRPGSGEQSDRRNQVRGDHRAGA